MNGLERFDWYMAHVLAGTFDEDAAREGFAPAFLKGAGVKGLVEYSSRMKSVLAAEVARHDEGNRFALDFEGHRVTGEVESEAPHRIIGLAFHTLPTPLRDDRVARAQFIGTKDAPLAELSRQYGEHGLVGVVAAGFTDDGAEMAWQAAGGYADLEYAQKCTFNTRMFAGSIVKLLTATTALKLVGDGLIDLDAPVNRYLRSLQVASSVITARQLLTHTAGVSSNFNHYVEEIGPAEDVLGNVVAVDFEPGTQYLYSNGGYTVLGEVIAGVTGMSAVDAITKTVLEPLGMVDSSFAMRWPDDVGPGYTADDGRAVPMPKLIPSVAAAGGLVTTTRDLGRFVAGWRSVLAADLAEAAITPQFARPDGGFVGFGWMVGDTMFGHAGGTGAYTSSLLWRPSDGAVNVLMTNRHSEAQTINLALMSEAPRA
jgi:D-alanyl-D-alanine carboxypeptidase